MHTISNFRLFFSASIILLVAGWVCGRYGGRSTGRVLYIQTIPHCYFCSALATFYFITIHACTFLYTMYTYRTLCSAAFYCLALPFPLAQLPATPPPILFCLYSSRCCGGTSCASWLYRPLPPLLPCLACLERSAVLYDTAPRPTVSLCAASANLLDVAAGRFLLCFLQARTTDFFPMPFCSAVDILRRQAFRFNPFLHPLSELQTATPTNALPPSAAKRCHLLRAIRSVHYILPMEQRPSLTRVFYRRRSAAATWNFCFSSAT